MNVPYGAALALVTAACWAVSPLCFSSAGRRIGSFPVALIRLLLASTLLFACLPLRLAAHAHVWPTRPQALYMAWSGIAGMGIGDVLAYEAFLVIGVLRTTLIQMIAPIAATIMAWFALGETLTPRVLLGIVIVIVATSFAVFVREEAKGDEEPAPKPSPAGLALAFIGAIFIGIGAVAGRQAFASGPGFDPFVATTVRVASAAAFLALVAVARRDAMPSFAALRERPVWTRIGVGVLAGPFFGMIAYVTALTLAPAGLVSALSATSPLFVMPMIAVRTQTRPNPAIVVAGLVSVIGVALVMGK